MLKFPELFLFITQRFKQAAQTFDNLENRERHLQKIYDLAKKYVSIKEEDDLFLETHTIHNTEDCKKIYNLPISSQNTIRHIFNIVNYAYLQDFYSTEDKVKLAQSTMINTNPCSNWQLKWSKIIRQLISTSPTTNLFFQLKLSTAYQYES